MAYTSHGAFAEEVKAEASRLVAIPEGMDFATASAFLLTYGTSDHALRDRGELRAGETLLVLGAAGGVGLAAVEIGKALGAVELGGWWGAVRLRSTRYVALRPLCGRAGYLRPLHRFWKLALGNGKTDCHPERIERSNLKASPELPEISSLRSE